jgi:hypothetical protein
MAKRITLEEFKSELQRFCKEYIDECLADYEGRDDSAKVLHWFEEVYMQKHLADMCLDHTTFRLFLRLVLSQYYTKKDVDKLLSDQKWFLLDFINESILTVLPYKNENGELMTDKPIEELVGRVLYDFKDGVFTQYRDDAEGDIFNYVLSKEELRDFQIVFMENMSTLEESIYYMKDEALQSILASEEHAGFLSKEDKIKLDKTTPDEYLKEVSISGENLPKENAVVDIPKATNTTLGVVKAGENVTIGEDGSVNVDIPVSIDEVVNLRSITTEPTTANEGDCYYNGTTTLIHYYIDDAWDAGAEPQKSKVYFFEDGQSIHQYRSDGDKLIEIQDTPQIATDTTVGIVKGGADVKIDADGTMRVPAVGTLMQKVTNITNDINEIKTQIEEKEYDVATTTELGLVMASEEGNDTAEQIKADGNVQVDAKGKMRVRKIVEEKSEGYDKNRFIVNPDKTIEELRDGKWEDVISETKTVIDDLILKAQYSYPWQNNYNDTLNAIKKGVLHIELPEGSVSATLTVSGPEVIQTRPGRFIDTRSQGVCSNGTPVIRREYYENVIYDIKLTDDFSHTDEYPKGLIEPSYEYRGGGYYVRKFPITKSGDYYVFLQTTGAYLEYIEGTSTSLCLTTALKNDEASETPWPKETVTLQCSCLQKVTTAVKYSGQNIVLGKNGLLIEGTEGDAYVKVLDDGRIEHNFGATQNTGQANVIEQVRVNDTTLPITNKIVNIQIAQNGELIEPDAEGVIDIIASGGGTATVPDAVEDNVVTFATEGQLKDSGKKIGGEEFGEYEQIPVREVIGNGQYGSEAGKVYGYCVAKNDVYINNEIVYKEKECITAIGKIHYSAPYALLLFNIEGDVNSGFVPSASYDVKAGYNIVHYLTGERIIDANTIATEKGVENYLTTFNLVAPKFKTGDVVYSTNVPNFHFGVMSWEDYEKNPTNSMDTKMPIGLVVDPVKRTFLFCELLNKYFCNSENIETYFGGYTSFEDGAEAFERISKLKGTSKVVDIPAFYGLRNSSNSDTIFYVKSDDAYVPALKEWKIAKEHLCTAFYGDDNSYAGFMDRLIALKNGVTLSSTLFMGYHDNNTPKLFYSQISTVGKALMSGTVANKAYNMNGEMPGWDNATDENACCPVFGIYTEEEENA